MHNLSLSVELLIINLNIIKNISKFCKLRYNLKIKVSTFIVILVIVVIQQHQWILIL